MLCALPNVWPKHEVRAVSQGNLFAQERPLSQLSLPTLAVRLLSVETEAESVGGGGFVLRNLCTGPSVFPTLSGMRELGLEKLSGSTVALC